MFASQWLAWLDQPYDNISSAMERLADDTQARALDVCNSWTWYIY
jgi:hypothetical protein